MSIKATKKEILDKVRKVLSSRLPEDFKLELEIPPGLEMGDLSLACFNLAKFLKEPPAKISRDLAAELKKVKSPIFEKVHPTQSPTGRGISPSAKLFNRVKNVGPYLNFFLKKEIWFKEVCEEILKKKEKFARSDIGRRKRILIEYSAPNTNKPQHLGHLRNNFLGMSLADLLGNLSYRVIKANLINDRGIHITKSMLAYQKWGEGKTPRAKKIKPDHFVGNYYVLFEKKAKEYPELLDEVHLMLKKWERGDRKTLTLWKKMTSWAMKGLKETYKKLGTRFDKWYFESKIYNLGRKIILEALKKGLCYKRSDGAIEIDLTEYGLDKKVLIRADGTSVYLTQDIGLAKLKYDDFRPAKSIYVVASEQDYHFKVLFKILEIFGYSWADICQHLSYGMVFLPEGKMKSREGVVIDADDIISRTEDLARKEILVREQNLGEKEISHRAKVIAEAALKFYFLKFTPEQVVHFKPEESISFEGATGPYVQYAYARIQSIIKKFPISNFLSQGRISAKGRTQCLWRKFPKINYSVLGNKEEVEIVKFLFQFPEVIKTSGTDYNPACLANYLLKLAQAFNTFYQRHRVLQAENKNLVRARLALIQAVALVIKKGLNLLGIKVLNKM